MHRDDRLSRVRSVVDAGCGSGRMTRLLSSLGVDTSGIDLSAGMIDVARRTCPGLGFEVAELGKLPVLRARSRHPRPGPEWLQRGRSDVTRTRPPREVAPGSAPRSATGRRAALGRV